jgi:hypothetical protein
MFKLLVLWYTFLIISWRFEEPLNIDRKSRKVFTVWSAPPKSRHSEAVCKWGKSRKRTDGSRDI